MCLYPKFIPNRKYIPNKKNNGIIPPCNDERVKYVPIGCGKCMECKKQKSREWQVRLHEELRTNKNALFVTLSFSDKSLIELENILDSNLSGYELDNKIATLATRRFLERWRKEFKTSVKHWFVTELGQTNTERIHIHGIIFITNSKEKEKVSATLNNSINVSNIERIWKYGNVWIGDYVNEKTINYIVKYIYKIDKKHPDYNSIILCSKGIGSNYITRSDSNNNKFNGKKTNELYITRSGVKLPLPKYYRNKLYTDEQKESLWLNLLDKQTRYVNGIKIDVSKSEEDYFNVLKEQRIINKKLGYGDDKKNWQQINYEKHLRNIKRLQRINKVNKDAATIPIAECNDISKLSDFK